MSAAAALWRAAVITAAAHLAAGLLSGAFVLPGAPGAPLVERLAHVAAAGWGWRLAWLSWIVAGLTLIALLRLALRELPGEPLAGAATALAIAALVTDAPCDVAQAWLLPRLAGEDPGAFLVAERWLTVGGYTVANGLYSVAALLLTAVLARRGHRWVLATGVPLAGVGLWLAAIGALASFEHAARAAALTVALCLVWTFHLAWALAGPPPRFAGLSRMLGPRSRIHQRPRRSRRW